MVQIVARAMWQTDELKDGFQGRLPLVDVMLDPTQHRLEDNVFAFYRDIIFDVLDQVLAVERVELIAKRDSLELGLHNSIGDLLQLVQAVQPGRLVESNTIGRIDMLQHKVLTRRLECVQLKDVACLDQSLHVVDGRLNFTRVNIVDCGAQYIRLNV